MAGSINKVTILGRLGQDPESKSFQNGGKVVNLSVATSESWKDKQSGEKREKVEWHRVTIFNEGLAGVAEKYLRKGSRVYLEGALQTRKWQAQDGSDRYATEIVLQGYGCQLVLLDQRDGGGEQGGYERGAARGSTRQQAENRPASGKSNYADLAPGELDDEVPF